MQAATQTWSEQLPNDLLAIDDARYTAMMASDLKTLDRILSEHLVYTHSDGQTDSKREYLGLIEDGQLRYRSYLRETPSCLLLGEQALVRGVLRLEAHFKGREASIRIHYLAVWTRCDGAWQLAAWASTRLPEVPQ